MRVRPEVSQLSTAVQVVAGGLSIPSLTTRRAETTVELASGQSFAIAGLIQDNSRQEHTKIPGLGDLPILGALFQSDRFQRNETELVIIVTPSIVRPVDADALQTTLDRKSVVEGKSVSDRVDLGGRRIIKKKKKYKIKKS